MWQKNSAFFTEIEPFFDQITLNDFTLNGLDIQFFLSLQEHLQTEEKSLLSKHTSKSHLEQQINEQTQYIAQQEQEKKKLIANIAQLDQHIASIDTSKIQQLKYEKTKQYEAQQALEAEVQHITIPLDTTIVAFSPDKEEGGHWAKRRERKGVSLAELITLIQTLKER
ncbi:MAG: hypothetical protein LBP53_05795 [Candidatus Peribacteria bacterium]|nr:hypothetical protein [Candidatus Peribacteria bacterium]